MVVLTAGILGACTSQPSPEATTWDIQPHAQSGAILSGTLAFKQEYEALNDDEHMHLNIPTDISVHPLDYTEVKNFLEKGTGVLYFGFPTCPRCRNLVPELFETLKQNQITDLYYYNPKEIRDLKKLDETTGKIIVETPTSPEYQWLLDRMQDILPAYEKLNDESIKRIYVPFVVVVKDGEIVGHHLNTLDEQTDPKVPLTDAQKKKLRNLLTIQVFPLINETCDITAGDDPSC